MLTLDLSSRIAIVTGATGDLGRLMTRTFAQCGADVAIHYHVNRGKADELAQEVEALGCRASVVRGDVGDLDSVMAMRDTVHDALGAPDIVVTNAVNQIYPWRSVLEEDPADYGSQYATCVLQNVFMAKAFVPAMVERRAGRFIGINTECSVRCDANASAYSSAKRGMDGVLRCLAREIGVHQVTVNQIAPGWMFSDRDRDRTEPGEGAEYASTVPLRRRGDDRDIANLAAFLAFRPRGLYPRGVHPGDRRPDARRDLSRALTPRGVMQKMRYYSTTSVHCR